MSALWSNDRPEFTERIASLAGGTTYRTPVAGRGTKQDQLPDEHAIATALSFARRGPEDIGPDVAYCWVLQSDAYRAKVMRIICDHLYRTSRISRVHAAQAVGSAWDAMIHDRKSGKDCPSDIDQRSYDALLLLVVGILHTSAWDTLAAAERAYHRAA